MRPNSSLPWAARVLSACIVGDDADVLRGDLEERYRRRVAAEGNSAGRRAAVIGDAALSLVHWWWARAHRRSPASRAPRNREGIMTTIGPDFRQMWRGLL